MHSNLTVIILTFNEQAHIARALTNVKKIAEEIIVIDSFSTDNTINICKEFNVRIHQHKFENQARQLNWTLENVPIHTEWVLRLDADEILSNELISEMSDRLKSLPSTVNGIYLKRGVYFMNKIIRWGGYYPTWILRIWRNGLGVFEDKWMDEHLVVKGQTIRFKSDFYDVNLNNLSWWIIKHDKYASREALEILKTESKKNDWIEGKLFTRNQVESKQWLKNRIYLQSPLFVRALMYFLYRYIIRLGFLDGRIGLIWHFLQGFWYRFLIDAKIYKVRKKLNASSLNFTTIVHNELGIKLD